MKYTMALLCCFLGASFCSFAASTEESNYRVLIDGREVDYNLSRLHVSHKLTRASTATLSFLIEHDQTYDMFGKVVEIQLGYGADLPSVFVGHCLSEKILFDGGNLSQEMQCNSSESHNRVPTPNQAALTLTYGENIDYFELVTDAEYNFKGQVRVQGTNIHSLNRALHLHGLPHGLNINTKPKIIQIDHYINYSAVLWTTEIQFSSSSEPSSN